MAMQTINIGNAVNDGLGDDLRSAFQKVNNNFSYLTTELATTVINLGNDGESLFVQKTGSNLELKKIKAGANVTVTPYDTMVMISADPAFSTISTNAGTASASVSDELQLVTTKNLSVIASGNTITFDTNAPLYDMAYDYDFGTLSNIPKSVVHAMLANSNIEFGTILQPSRYNLDLGTLG